MTFAHGGGIHYSLWASMPQLGQWLWSWPFLQVFGSTHFTLRFSVIILSWLGLVAFCDLLRQRNVPAQLAGFAGCVLATNPLFFVSQGTYMTDVPALSFGLIALSCYGRAASRKNPGWLSGAVVLAVFAVLTRQTMVAVPVAAGLMLWEFRELRLKPLWLLSLIVPVAVCVGTQRWFMHRKDVLPMQAALNWKELPIRIFAALHLCGLLVLPLVFLKLRRKSWLPFAVAFAIMLLAAAGIFLFVKGLPYGGLFPYCTGMLSLAGTYSNGLVIGQREVLLTQPLRVVITILGCVGGAEILTALADTVRARKWPGVLLWFAVIEFLAVLVIPEFMDRYLEVLFPGAIFLVVARGFDFEITWFPGGLLVALCWFVSVALMHDWLAWNAARWDLGRLAVTSKSIPPNEIEGGFEWDGWYATSDPEHSEVLAGPRNDGPGLVLAFSRQTFPQVTGRFALAFNPVAGSAVVGTAPYKLWLPPRRKEMLLLVYTGPEKN